MNVDEPGVGYAEALAAELKWQLKQRNISGSALGGMLQIGQRTISQWLNGRNKIPFTFVYSASLVMGARPGSLFKLAEQRYQTESPLLVTGNPDRRDPSQLSPEELGARSERFVQCIAAELRTQLSLRELSTRQIALTLGKAPSIAGEWLNGKKVLPVHFAYNVCQALGFPVEDLVDRAEARIDRYPEDPDEISLQNSGSTTALSSRASLSPGEVSRRLRAMLELKGLDGQSGFDTAAAAALSHGITLDRRTWDDALKGIAVPDASVLAEIAEALGAPADYLIAEDDDITERAEAEAELARVAAEAGVTNIAARGAHLSAESLREIANLVNRYIPK
ncbi:hypothetical protein Leucomu_10650 [Leucobacter muris]|uniref:HTH cro/C1-type domain-containing protein n=1 Tax=Leucobacter muris TaxID=1935379 RepID=A0ABX5QGV9_9MICO|nr:helix-turn-helix transcriptional regulator [Leucobacter muris]QAB18314.1 hypothetical protein Leucomu_10650 [Leucobacter muris]